MIRRLRFWIIASIIGTTITSLMVPVTAYADAPVSASDCTNITVLAFRGAGSSSGGANRAILNYDSDGDGQADAVGYGDNIAVPDYFTNGYEGTTIHRVLVPALRAAKASGLSISVIGMGPDEGYAEQKSRSGPPYLFIRIDRRL